MEPTYHGNIIDLPVLPDFAFEPNMTERLQVETLCPRDGGGRAKEWARWAATLHRRSISDSTHYASPADKKPLFEEDSIAQLEAFTEAGKIP